MDTRASLVEFLERAGGEPFCDGCLALQVGAPLLEVRAALAGEGGPMVRATGRCSVCFRTLEVTRIPARSAQRPPS